MTIFHVNKVFLPLHLDYSPRDPARIQLKYLHSVFTPTCYWLKGAVHAKGKYFTDFPHWVSAFHSFLYYTLFYQYQTILLNVFNI